MTAPLAGDPIRASDTFGFTTFTPAWTNVTLGTGATSEGWYQQIGEMVLWGFRVQFGTSPSFSASIRLDLPVAAYTAGGSNATMGVWNFRDTGSINYSGGIQNFLTNGTDVCFAGAWDGADPLLRITNGVPHAVNADDVLSGSGVYRAA